MMLKEIHKTKKAAEVTKALVEKLTPDADVRIERDYYDPSKGTWAVVVRKHQFPTLKEIIFEYPGAVIEKLIKEVPLNQHCSVEESLTDPYKITIYAHYPKSGKQKGRAELVAYMKIKYPYKGECSECLEPSLFGTIEEFGKELCEKHKKKFIKDVIEPMEQNHYGKKPAPYKCPNCNFQSIDLKEIGKHAFPFTKHIPEKSSDPQEDNVLEKLGVKALKMLKTKQGKMTLINYCKVKQDKK